MFQHSSQKRQRSVEWLFLKSIVSRNNICGWMNGPVWSGRPGPVVSQSYERELTLRRSHLLSIIASKERDKMKTQEGLSDR